MGWVTTLVSLINLQQNLINFGNFSYLHVIFTYINKKIPSYMRFPPIKQMKKSCLHVYSILQVY